MGFTSDITNRIDGKKYRISTAEDKKDGGWQTAVLKYRLFGIPDLVHPAMFIGAPDEEHARQVHTRVEQVVAELPSSEWESAKWKLFEEILDKAVPAPDVNTFEALRDKGGVDWSIFRGVPNTPEVLYEKARVIAALIEIDLDDGINLASGFKENPEYSEVRLGEEQARRVRGETAVVLLRLVDEIASGVLGSEEQVTLIDELVLRVADILDRSGGLPASEFEKLLSERLAAYAQFPTWTEQATGSMLWEYAKKIGAIVNIEKHPVFNAMLTNLLLRSVERWELKDLLAGQAEA